MHLALLYLLSNPDEFQKALKSHPPRGATTLSAWNAEYDDEDESVISSATATATPLPFVVFADDAEVVLPQAHTASQLFGIERVEGIELEERPEIIVCGRTCHQNRNVGVFSDDSSHYIFK